MLSDQHLVLLVYLNLLLSYNNIFGSNSNLANNYLSNHLLDLLQLFECHHVFINLFTGWSKKFDHQSKHFSFLYLELEDKLRLIKSSKYQFCPCSITFEWYLVRLIVRLNPDFNCWNSFALSLADKVTTGT